MFRLPSVDSSPEIRPAAAGGFWGFALCCALAAAYAATQPLASQDGSLFLDAKSYFELTSALAAGEPLAGPAPFVYRPGMPWLVATLAPAGAILETYRLLGFGFGLGALALLLVVSRRVVGHPGIAALLGVLFVIDVNSPFRFNAFYPVMTDPAGLFFSFAILAADDPARPQTPGRALGLSALALLGVTFREFVLLAPLAVWLGYLAGAPRHDPQAWRRQVALRLLPVAAAACGLILVRQVATATTSYAYAEQTLHMLGVHLHQPLAYLLLPWVTYGPLLWLPAVLLGRPLLGTLARQPTLLAYGGGIAAFALIGGYHGVRIFFWGAIAFLPLIGLALRELRGAVPARRNRWAMLALVLLAQGLAMRVFLPLPDHPAFDAPPRPSHYVLSPYGETVHYSHSTPSTMSASLRALAASQYLALGACLALLRVLGRRSRTSGPGSVGAGSC